MEADSAAVPPAQNSVNNNSVGGRPVVVAGCIASPRIREAGGSDQKPGKPTQAGVTHLTANNTLGEGLSASAAAGYDSGGDSLL